MSRHPAAMSAAAAITDDELVDAVRGRSVAVEPALAGADPLWDARAMIRTVLARERYGVPQRSRAGARLSVSPVEAGEIGRSGVGRGAWDGLPRMESNPRLHPYWARGLCDQHGIYHEMGRGDGAIQGTISIVVREIARAHYLVEVPPDATEDERAAADLVERVFGLGKWESTGGWIRGGFRQLLTHALKSIVYGFSPVELTWGRANWAGRAVRVPVRAAWRAPWSIERWYWQGDQLVAMGQRVDDFWSYGAAPRVIPLNRCLLFVNDYVDGNPEGTSMLRAAYIPWRAKKDTILRHQTAEENLFGGTVVVGEAAMKDGRPYRGATQKDIESWEKNFPRWVSGEVPWIKKPFGWEITKSHPEFEIPSRVEELKYYDHQIFLTGLAALLGLDASHAASRALSDGLGQVMYNAIAGKAQELCDVINGKADEPWTGVIRTLCDINFRTDETFRHPRIVPFGIEHQDMSQLIDFMTKGAQFRALTFGVEDELLLRRVSGLLVPDRAELEERRRAMHTAGGDATQISQSDTQGSVMAPLESGGSAADIDGDAPTEVPDVPDAAPVATDNIQDENLNGAQAATLQSILRDVTARQLPIDGSVILVRRAFPSFSEEDARKMIESGGSFVPAVLDPQAAPTDEEPADE